MKISSRGFTLVELMIVIAIIGILAAVLFPSVTRYLANGRDTNRTAGIGQIATAITSFSASKGTFPDGTGTAGGVVSCVDSSKLANELPKFPTDPQSTRRHGNCDKDGVYGYGTGSNSSSTPMYMLSAVLESSNGGNTGSVTAYQGYGLTSTIVEATFTKGSGSGYVLSN